MGYNISLFNDTVCFKIKHHIELMGNAKPVAHPSRKISLPLQSQFQSTLNEMYKIKHYIIKKVDDPTDLANSVVFVGKNNGQLGICSNARDLNLAIKRNCRLNSIKMCRSLLCI